MFLHPIAQLNASNYALCRHIYNIFILNVTNSFISNATFSLGARMCWPTMTCR